MGLGRARGQVDSSGAGAERALEWCSDCLLRNQTRATLQPSTRTVDSVRASSSDSTTVLKIQTSALIIYLLSTSTALAAITAR